MSNFDYSLGSAAGNLREACHSLDEFIRNMNAAEEIENSVAKIISDNPDDFSFVVKMIGRCYPFTFHYIPSDSQAVAGDLYNAFEIWLHGLIGKLCIVRPLKFTDEDEELTSDEQSVDEHDPAEMTKPPVNNILKFDAVLLFVLSRFPETPAIRKQLERLQIVGMKDERLRIGDLGDDADSDEDGCNSSGDADLERDKSIKAVRHEVETLYSMLKGTFFYVSNANYFKIGLGELIPHPEMKLERRFALVQKPEVERAAREKEEEKKRFRESLQLEDSIFRAENEIRETKRRLEQAEQTVATLRTKRAKN